MKHATTVLLVAVAAGTMLPAQTTAKPTKKVTAPVVSTAPASDQEMNIRAYIELLRTDVKNRKAKKL